MNIQESINRGFNLLGTSIVGLSGFAFLPEVIFEKDVPDKIDDAVLFILALVAMWWYNRSNNRYVRSIAPIVFVVLALITKIGAIIVEFDDPESVGDDMGALVLFVLSTGLMLYQWGKTKKLLASLQ